MAYSFTEEELLRYSRNILLKEIGIEGQARIRESSILVIGAGGLGSPILLYLAAAGVGTLGIADKDKLDLSNLQRQIIHDTVSVGEEKTTSAERRIKALNPNTTVRIHDKGITKANIMEIIAGYDFIVEATDQRALKYMVNDACVLSKKPFSIGGVFRFQGQTMTYVPGSACYRCIFPHAAPKEQIPTCSEAGILGGVAGMLGTIQAVEALKYLSGTGELLTDKLLVFDALSMRFNSIDVPHSESCPLCGKNPTITSLGDYEESESCSL